MCAHIFGLSTMWAFKHLHYFAEGFASCRSCGCCMWTGREERGVSWAPLSSSIDRYTITAFKSTFQVREHHSFWLLLVRWKLSLRGFLASPLMNLFQTMQCRFPEKELILQQKGYSAEPDEKSCCAVCQGLLPFQSIIQLRHIGGHDYPRRPL